MKLINRCRYISQSQDLIHILIFFYTLLCAGQTSLVDISIWEYAQLNDKKAKKSAEVFVGKRQDT